MRSGPPPGTGSYLTNPLGLRRKIQTHNPARRDRRREPAEQLGCCHWRAPVGVLILRVSPTAPEPAPIARAAAVLRAGGLVALPTETVYGLGAHALDEAAVRRIFEAKGRPAYNPLIVHVADAGEARRLTRQWSESAARLADRFWPGPLTLVLRKAEVVPDLVTAGLDSVALRVPAHPVAQAVLREAGLPVAAPSANRFTELSPTTAEHVARGLGDRVDLILDAGAAPVGIESTVLDLTGERPLLLRPGSIDAAEIEAVVGPLGSAAAPPAGETPRPAPGMLDRHYAPRARLRLFEADDELERLSAAEAAAGGTTGALLLRPRRSAAVAHAVAMPNDASAYAALLYATLHRLDAAGCTLVLVERPPSGAAWAGIADRLRRAAS
jgi:L-threonylcarbamoyladenylate synthase